MKRILFLLFVFLQSVFLFAQHYSFTEKLREAGNGSPEAMVIVGTCYANGKDVEKDDKQAFYWFNKAAELGNSYGILSKGTCYLLGVGIAKDINKGIEYIEKAANMSNNDAQYALAREYYTGKNVAIDKAKGLYWLTKAAENSHIGAQGMLGWIYFSGDGVTQNYKKSYEWFSKAADNGDIGSCYYTGICYLEGKGVEKNLIKAKDYIEKAANRGYADAQYNMGRIYDFGIGVEKDARKAFSWYKLAYESGSLYANIPLGYFYIKGIGVEKDPKKGVDHLEKAAIAGIAESQRLLGVTYLLGDGVEKDEIKGFNWIKKAADNGDIYALDPLSICYSKGMGTNKDEEKAVSIYKTAAEKGVPSAMSNLGDAYENGRGGLNIDYKQAVLWYKKAAEKGNSFGQNNLANCYAKGHGVAIDYKQAEMWYRKSIENDNNPYAHFGLALLYARGLGVNKNKQMALQHMELAEKYKKEEFVLNEAAVLRDKGEIYYYLDDIDNAKKIWAELQSDYPYEIGVFLAHEDDEFVHNMQNSNSNIDFEIPITSKKNGDTFAFIFANEDYRRVETVPFAKNDGKIFAEYCRKTLGIPEKNVHLNTNATLGDMKYNISLMKQIADAFDGTANFILYYAGHGLPSENQQDAYLLPVDGYGADGTGYSIKELYKELGMLNSKSIILFFDACFSGSKREGGMVSSSRGVAIKAKSDAPQGNVIVFSAAQGDETAYPYKEQGHGLFTYFLLKKLQETKGETTLGELANYIVSGVKKTSIVENGKIQTPTVTTSGNTINWKEMKMGQ